MASHGSASPSCLSCTPPVSRYNLLQKSGQSHAIHPPTTLYVSLEQTDACYGGKAPQTLPRAAPPITRLLTLACTNTER